MRVGWVRTYTGKYVCLLKPDPSTIDLVDIAHHLSLECRWGGATQRHFSVAEHSIWVARFTRELVPEEHRDAATVHALLHDAHEAYLKDIPTPIKRLLDPGYSQLCTNIDVAIRAHLGLQEPDVGVAGAIHMADQYACWCEAKALVAPCVQGKPSGTEPPEGLHQKVPMTSEIRRASNAQSVEQAYLHYLKFALRQLCAS